MSKIRVAIVGVGNCASALIQGTYYYRTCITEKDIVGLEHPVLGGYNLKDVAFVSAFDVDARKVGKDLAEAIFSPPNNTLKLIDVPKLNVPVSRGPVLDGVGESLASLIKIKNSISVDVADVLGKNNVEIVVNLLPSGASQASEWYANEAIKAGCAFINATPAFIASTNQWARRFTEAHLPLVGDDLTDQVGATVLHKVLLKTLATRGVKITETYQLDVGGGSESLNTLQRSREVKRDLKTKTVETALPYEASVVAGSTDYVDFLENRRDSYFWIKGFYFGGVPMQLDLRLNTVDAPNAGSVLLDVIRAVRIALDRKISGPLPSVSSCFFKRPPQVMSQEKAAALFENFILGNTKR